MSSNKLELIERTVEQLIELLETLLSYIRTPDGDKEG